MASKPSKKIPNHSSVNDGITTLKDGISRFWKNRISSVRKTMYNYILGSVVVILIAGIFDYFGEFGNRFLGEIVNVILALATSFVASALFFVMIFFWTDRDWQNKVLEYARQQMLDTAGKLHEEFVPAGHFNLETKDDQEFWQRSKETFAHTRNLYYSGLDARTSLARMLKHKNGELKRALFRIPLTKESIERAIKIRIKMVDIHLGRASEPNSQMPAENSERPDIADDDASYEAARKYVVERVWDCMRFALVVSKNYSAEILIKDWDETNNFRTEFMDDAIFLGNYHTRGEYSRFSPGTCQFPKSSFIHRIMEPGIVLQIESAAAEAISSSDCPPPATDAPGAPATQAAAERAPAPPPATDAPDARPTKPATLRIKGDRNADMIFNFWSQTEAGRIYYNIPVGKKPELKDQRKEFINEEDIKSSMNKFCLD